MGTVGQGIHVPDPIRQNCRSIGVSRSNGWNFRDWPARSPAFAGCFRGLPVGANCGLLTGEQCRALTAIEVPADPVAAPNLRTRDSADPSRNRPVHPAGRQSEIRRNSRLSSRIVLWQYLLPVCQTAVCIGSEFRSGFLSGAECATPPVPASVFGSTPVLHENKGDLPSESQRR